MLYNPFYMDKAELEKLKEAAEQRCQELFNQLQNVTTELERTRGDFRTYETLLANWTEEGEEKIEEAIKKDIEVIDGDEPKE